MVVIGQKWLYSGKSGFIWAIMLYSGKNGCIRARWLYLVIIGSDQAKKVVFGQKWLHSGKVVVVGKK